MDIYRLENNRGEQKVPFNPRKQGLTHLPLQSALVDSARQAFLPESSVIAAVLLGSLASGKGDRVSDADIVVFIKSGFRTQVEECFASFEKGKEVFYLLEGSHSEDSYFRKYIFGDLTSTEIHCLSEAELFNISRPFEILFDKTDLINGKLTDSPPPSHAEFPVYTNGDAGLIWELFDCIKWLSRGNNELAKSYLKRLSEKL